MDLAELIVAGNEATETEETPDPRTDPAGALDFHRRQFPRNQRVADDAIEVQDKSDRVRLRGVIEQIAKRGLRVCGIESAHHQSGAQVQFSGRFGRSGELGSATVQVRDVPDQRDTLAELQELLQSAGLNAVVTLQMNIVITGKKSGEDLVRYVEAGGRTFHSFGSSDAIKPEDLLVWHTAIPRMAEYSIRSWIDGGYTPEQVMEWEACQITGQHEVGSWQRLGQNAKQAKAWRDAGIMVFQAGEWLTAGKTPADAELWTAVGIANYPTAAAWQAEGMTPEQVAPWIAMHRSMEPGMVRPLLRFGVDQDTAQQLAEAGNKLAQLDKLVDWTSRYKIELAEAIEWAKLGPDFIGPGKRGRWHKAGFTPEEIRRWQTALRSRNISVEQVQALKAGGFDPETGAAWEAVHPSMGRRGVFEPWVQAGLAPEDAEPWVALHESFVSYSRVASWLEAGLTPADAEPWAQQAVKSERKALCDYETVEAWQDAHPRCANNPELVAQLMELTTPEKLPQILDALA